MGGGGGGGKGAELRISFTTLGLKTCGVSMNYFLF